MKTNLFSLLLLIFLCVFSCKVKDKEVNSSEVDREGLVSTMEIFKEKPEIIRPVNDYSDILTSNEEKQLSQFIMNYKKSTDREIAIVIIDSIKPYNDPLKMAKDLANYWGIGTVKENNGLVILISFNSRQMSMATGIETEKKLTDEECKYILDKVILPQFSKENYADGLENGITEIMLKWDE